jgi:hypothetical protein
MKGGATTMPKQIVLKFPVDLPEMILNDKETFEKGKETIVTELLRKGEISHGKTAGLLGITHQGLLDMMTGYDIQMEAVTLKREMFLKYAGTVSIGGNAIEESKRYDEGGQCFESSRFVC